MPELRVGVVGLGMMGGGIARTLRRAGLLAAVCDLDAALVADLAGGDVVACATGAAVASVADVVVVVVFDAAQVDAVLFGPGGIAEGTHAAESGPRAGAGGRTGPAVLVCSTIAAGDFVRLAARAAAQGITVLDVGIAGGPELAEHGELVTLVGGERDAVAGVEPVLRAMSGEVVHAGPLGSGMALKLVKNTMSYLTLCAVHEALLLGEELGFDAALVRRVAERSHLVDHFFWFPMSRPSAHPLPPGAALDSARFFAGIARKDLAAAAAAGLEAGVDLPVTALAARLADRFFLVPEGGGPEGP